MATYAYERLSGQDNDFLRWESPSLPMHVGGIQLFAVGELRNDDGGIDFETLKRLTESLLHRIPRYRQKLAWIPRENPWRKPALTLRLMHAIAPVACLARRLA